VEVRPGYKQTEAGVIPLEWEPRGLLSTVSIASGQVDPRKEPYKSMTLVAPDHIESGTGKLLAMRTAVEQGAISGKYLFGAGDIVYSKIRPYLRKAVLVEFAGLCSADMYPLRPVEGVVSGYVLPVLLGHRFSKYAESVSVRSGMPKINRVELSDFCFAVPPRHEQQAIAAALSDVDALLAGLDRLIAKKRDIKQAAMQQLLTGQTRLPGFQGEWEIKRLEELADIDPENLGAATAPDYSFKYISLEDVDFGVLRACSEQVFGSAPSRARRRLRPGDVLVSTVRPNLKSHLLFDLTDSDWVCSTGFSAVRAKRNQSHPGYLFAHFFAHGVSRQIETLLTGSNYPAINSADVRRLELPAPAYAEQAAIATVLSDMDAELTALEARRDKTRALKQGMMQELLTGRTRLV